MVKILIVDDVQINANLLEFYVNEYFSELGMKVDIDISLESEEAYYAITKNEHYCYDLIFLDIMMPHIDGLEFLNLIRHELSIEQPKIIMTTSIDDQDVRHEESYLGANGFILKPYIKESIFSVLDRFF